MEDLVAYSHFIELSSDTRKIMLDMLRSMQSLFPFNPGLAARGKDIDNTTVMIHARKILEIVNEKPEIFDGIFDPDDLKKYIKTVAEFSEIVDQIEKLHNTVREYQDLACFLCSKLVMMIHEHLEMTCPDEYQSLHKDLSGLFRPATGAFIKKEKCQLRVV